MDQAVLEFLLHNTELMVADIREAGDIGKLGMLMMQIEVELGRVEAKDAEQNGGDPEYVEALDEMWGVFCTHATDQALKLGFDPNTIDRERVERDLYDNYFHAAVAGVAAARIHETAKQLPLLAWAAFNKNSYKGYKDEIAILRMLLWAGYDPNTQDERGMTALHYMASMNNYPYSHPRAVRLLIEAGANPDIRNQRGDSALCYLAGNRQWSDALTSTAAMLLSLGADPLLAANDGATPLGLLKENCDDEEREGIIAFIEAALLNEVPAPEATSEAIKV